MPYVQSWTSLRGHWKLTRLHDRLAELGHHTSRPVLIGHLHLLWWWVLEYAPAGDLGRFTDTELAAAAEWPHDPAALVDALTYAELVDKARTVHDWARYAGEMLRKRDVREAARVAREEARQSAARASPEPAGFASLRAYKARRKDQQ